MTERLTPEVAMKKIAALGGQRWVTMFSQKNLELEFYAPRGTDPQQPHTRDEMYFIQTGSATFVMDGERRKVGPGEVIFAAAGVAHRFEEISNDFSTWAIFVPTG